MSPEERVGVVSRWFPDARAAEVNILASDLQIGDRIHLKGAEHDFLQIVDEIKLAHRPISRGNAGEAVIVRLKAMASPGDEVWLVKRADRWE